jgi:bifunctional NMN adenylyltransferase/nudix hydrolase
MTRTITRPYDTSLIVGRFQGFHFGHEHLINVALSVADRVVILVGSSQEHNTAKNPFDVITRQSLIKEIFPGPEVIVGHIPDLDLSDAKTVDAKWAHHVLDTAKQHIRKIPDVYIYGGEPKNLQWFRHSKELIHLTKHMTEMIVAREKFNISGTIMRELMFRDKFDQWMVKCNSKLHKHYPELRAKYLAVPELTDAIRMHLRVKNQGWTDKPVLLTKGEK